LFAVTATDFTGRIVNIPVQPQRIVSLSPIATRVIAQFGLLNKVAGLDQNSYTMDLLPVSISNRTTSIVNVGNAKEIDEEALLRLKPDIVLTQYNKSTADTLVKQTGLIVLCVQNRLGMDYELYTLLGQALFMPARANILVAYMKNLVDRAEAIAASNTSNKPKVYVATDISLLHTFPHDPIIRICGGLNAAGSITKMNYWGGATVDLEFLLRCKPDILIVWIPFTKPQRVAELKKTLNKSRFAFFPAIENQRVYSFLEASAGKDYFYTMASISEVLHHFYPNQYTSAMMDADIKASLNIFYPEVNYNFYRKLRETITITK
jgi:iron complex transport system substrate-binding protein